jgi:hypothetical protein
VRKYVQPKDVSPVPARVAVDLYSYLLYRYCYCESLVLPELSMLLCLSRVGDLSPRVYQADDSQVERPSQYRVTHR